MYVLDIIQDLLECLYHFPLAVLCFLVQYLTCVVSLEGMYVCMYAHMYIQLYGDTVAVASDLGCTSPEPSFFFRPVALIPLTTALGTYRIMSMSVCV